VMIAITAFFMPIIMNVEDYKETTQTLIPEKA
jgi:hypothetical protein